MTYRINPPALGLLKNIHVPSPETTYLPGEIPFLSVKGGTQDVIRIELIFAAGNIHASPPLIASAANELVDEGTSNYTSAQLAGELDLYGAFLETECGADWSSITLYTLGKFLGKTLPLLTEIATAPSYPEHEVETFSTQGKQRLMVSMEKVDFLSRRKFAAALFGANTAYGYMPVPEDYDNVTGKQLKQFFEKYYRNGIFGVIVSGNFTSTEEDTIRKAIIDCSFRKGENTSDKLVFPGDGVKDYVKKEGAIQSAIRIGRKMFNRTHPDFFRFSILNTILGGYFGSRLMSNIREDKGYTYGIGSALISQKDNGYFFIATEVGSPVCSDAVREIYKEIARLRDELIPEEELDLVRKYLWGSFQRSIDGPFALADRHKALLLSGMGTGYFERYLDTLKTITPDQLRECARQWLPEAHLTEVIVGP